MSLDYQHNLMAAAGHQAEAALQSSMAKNKGEYLLVVTGSVPLNDGGIYRTIGGRTAEVILKEAARNAKAVIAIGACAHWGNIQAARPNPTGAVGVSDIVKDKPVVNIAGCPPIGDVDTATIVHYLTFGRVPELDYDGRPLFAYGARIHDQCPRRANFDAGQFVEAFDDEAARKGWCLYHVGCKGSSCGCAAAPRSSAWRILPPRLAVRAINPAVITDITSAARVTNRDRPARRQTTLSTAIRPSNSTLIRESNAASSCVSIACSAVPTRCSTASSDGSPVRNTGMATTAATTKVASAARWMDSLRRFMPHASSNNPNSVPRTGT